LIQKEAAAWLRVFAAHQDTPEGYGVRFELAQAYLSEAQELSKDPRSPKVANLYKLAQKELSVLAASDNDFQEKAAGMNLQISFQQLGETTPVAQLKDFEECYLKARYEMFRLQNLGEKGAKLSPEEMQQKRREHLKTAIAAFQRGLQFADEDTPFTQLGEARYYLTYIYLMAGDPYRAAVLGEDLARSRPPSKRAAAAAGYALQAYGDIALASKQAGDRERLRDLARFILEDNKTLWADEPVTQLARYQLALALLQEKKRDEAMDLLAKIAPDYPAYLYTQSQLALIAAAARREAQDPKQKLVYQKRMTDAFARTPKLPEGIDVATAQMYFAAQLEKGNLLYTTAFDHAVRNDLAQAGKGYAALDAFQAQLKKDYDRHAPRFPEESQADFALALGRLKSFARYGLAQAEYRAGHYDKVLAPAATGEVVAQVKKAPAGKPIQMKDHRIVGEILGLAMRAHVQKGEVSAARDILGLLRRLTGEGEETSASAGEVLRTLVIELKAQIRDLRERKDVKRLESTVKYFSQFLDEMASDKGKEGDLERLRFLAGCYASLDKHAEAAKLYAQVPDPKIDPKKAKLTPQEEKALQDYWLSQVNYGRSLRLAKDFKEARKVLERVVHDPLARGKFLAEKEQIHLLEDQQLYGTGITRWSQFMAHPQMKAALARLKGETLDEQKRIKELYFECYYHYTYCHFMYGKNHKVESKKKDYIQRAADKVVRLEGNPEAWELVGDRFRELLRNEPLLMEEYTRLKGGAK
jgi:hypothetical protein